MLERDFVVLSAYGSRNSAEVPLLIGRNLDTDVNVFADDGDRLIVADVAVKSFEFWVAAVYASRGLPFFFQQLAPFLDDPKWLVLVGD